LAEVGWEEKPEIIRLLRNEEKSARQKNPLERIMTVEGNGARERRVKTTTRSWLKD
jgi:hypothetical protein